MIISFRKYDKNNKLDMICQLKKIALEGDI